MEFKLNWTPDPEVPYPKTWLKFKAKDVNSDDLVEYRICDLPVNRFDDLFDLMENDFLVNEPGNSALGTGKDPESIKVLRVMCEAADKQKLISVCMKDGSDDICGFNVLYINCESDNINQQISGLFATENLKKIADVMAALYGDFDVFKHYNVDRYLASLGLSVAQKYGQRGIGLKLMEARKLIGVAHGLKITHSTFSSIYSNKLADKVGYELNKAMRWDDWIALNPAAPFNDTFTAKTWVL